MRFIHIFYIILCFLMKNIEASAPVWTMTPHPEYSPHVTLNALQTATIKYTVTNQSHRTHTLAMNPILGITQVTSPGNCSSSFTLSYQQSCILTLNVNGALLNSSIKGGPVLCQQGIPLQCYQPAANDVLDIQLVPVIYYLITPTAQTNGSITPDTPQTVPSGSNLSFTATPQTNYQVDKWYLDNGIAQIGGTSFTLTPIMGFKA